MHGEVVQRIELTPTITRIVLGGDGLSEYVPADSTDQYVKALFIPDGATYDVPFEVAAVREGPAELRPRGRRYTIRSWDPATRQVTIDFVVHGDVGFAGRWARRAQIGDRLQFEGPSGGYAPSTTADWHLLVGDESTLPAIAATLEQLRPDVPALVIAVVDSPDHELALDSPGTVDITWVHRSTDPRNPDLLPAAVRAAVFPEGAPDVFVHGEASEVRAIRKHLLLDRGIAAEGASISPYWRREYTDEAWREVKREFIQEMRQDA